MSGDSHDQERRHPTELRRSISENSQIELPGYLVAEIGCKSRKDELVQGAKTVWYYHEEHEKVLLADASLDRASVEPVRGVALHGVSNDALQADEVRGARLTVVTALPDHITERLRYDESVADQTVVLRPVYAENHAWLDTTYVSVYPQEAYDRAELPNVYREEKVERETEQPEPSVTFRHSHANSI